MESNRVDGRGLQLHDIEARNRRSRHYYVGAVASTQANRVAMGGVLKVLKEHVTALAVESNLAIYARPVTPAGLRLVKRHVFEKIDGQRTDAEK